MEPFRKVWIAGGTRGIGFGIARHILRSTSEAQLWVSGRDPFQSEGLAVLREEYGQNRVMAKKMDVTDPNAIEETCNEIAREAEKSLDLVLNTCGILHDDSQGGKPERRLRDVNADWAVYNFKVNALGSLLLARGLVEADAFNRSRLCCLANISAKVGSVSDNRIGSWYSYRGSKAAQNQFNKCIAIELSRMKRPVVCVGLHPGTVDTDLSKPFSKNIGHEIFSLEKASRQLMDVIQSIDKNKHHGQLLSWDGSIIPP